MRVIYPEQYEGYGANNRSYGRSRMGNGGNQSRMVHPNYETLPRARQGRDGRGRFTSAYNNYDSYGAMDEQYYNQAMEEDRRMIGFTSSMGGMGSMQQMQERGSAWSEGGALSMREAQEWVHSMSSGKGKERGEHWSMDETMNLLRQRGYRHDPAEWYAIMHAVYYDYCGVAKKYGLDKNDEFFADLAHAWLDDEDAVENKAAVYYDCIAE